jgi:hypothetical protein
MLDTLDESRPILGNFLCCISVLGDFLKNAANASLRPAQGNPLGGQLGAAGRSGAAEMARCFGSEHRGGVSQPLSWQVGRCVRRWPRAQKVPIQLIRITVQSFVRSATSS